VRTGHLRLGLATAALLLSVACSRQDEQARPASDATAPAQAQPAGTETPVDPAPTAEAPANPPAAAPTPLAPASSAAAERPATRQGATAGPPPSPPRPPAAPPAPDERAGALPKAPVSEASARPAAPRPIPVRMVSVPTDTRLRLSLQTALASDTSNVEDRVSARVADDVVVDGETVIPEGSRVDGRVTYAQGSGKVKGRAGLTVRFHTLTVGSRTYDIATEPVRREAAGTKAKDARNIGIGAGAGAVIGGIIGGRKGAGIGAAVGGAGGTGMVLATKGEEVRLPAGTAVTTRLADPLVIEMRPESR
jgi:hypothetical protein